MNIDELQERINAVPRVSLAHLPTPLDDCANLSASLGRHILMKRDDCTGLGLGGNKVRQHEFILAAAIAAGADCLIQGAAAQSNHSRQLAAACAKLGLDVYLLPKADQFSSPIQGNYLIDHLTAAVISPIDPNENTTARKNELAAQLRKAGRKPYIVGMGSDEALALAAVAYVNALIEIISAAAKPPRWIVTTSQGSTQAGLQLGCELLGLEQTKVVGICPLGNDHEAYIPPEGIAAIAGRAAQILGTTSSITASSVCNLTDYVGDGYGLPSALSADAVRLVARSEGILLDPIYSGKGFAGLIDLVQRDLIPRGDDIVFVHTGGLPLIFVHAGFLSGESVTAGAESR